MFMRTSDHQLDDFFGLKPDTQEPRHHKESLRESLIRRFSIAGWLHLMPKVLSFRERYIVLGFLLLAIGAIIAIPITSYYHYTVELPASGGSFTEGVIGGPRYINPLLAQASDTDRDLTTLVYSGLLKYNGDGKLIPDLAKSYEVSSDGLTYTIYLRDDATWHDGEKFTAEDVVFTIQTAQKDDYVSSQRSAWLGVEITKVNDMTVLFKLSNKYAQFLNNLTIGILPYHLWKDVKPANFALSELNLKPIGTGPYLFKKYRKDKLGRMISFEFMANQKYYAGVPHISTIDINFFASEDEMVDAYNRGQIDNISYISARNLKKLKFKSRLIIQRIKFPRYFAVFFDQNQSKALNDKNVRIAISHATDKNGILSRVLDSNGIVVNSPMIGGILDINPSVKTYEYDPARAKEILASSGWTAGQDGILVKGKERLTIKLVTSTWPELTDIAAVLKEQWHAVGIDVTVEPLQILQLQQTIKNRSYQALLFGEILNIDPDPFSLWHSSQKRDPGLNLALYENRGTDTLLEEARQTLNPLERAQKYDEFQKLIVEDIPALFLYSPYYIYGQTKNIHGFSASIIGTPANRFSEIEKWYINTRRSFTRQ